MSWDDCRPSQHPGFVDECAGSHRKNSGRDFKQSRIQLVDFVYTLRAGHCPIHNGG